MGRGAAREGVAHGHADPAQAEVEGKDDPGPVQRQAWPALGLTLATSTPSDRQAASHRSS